MSANAETVPRTRIGPGPTVQWTPSVLVAKWSSGVVHDPGIFTLYTAQNSPFDATHCTSMCQAKAFSSKRSVATGFDQLIPSTQRRSSTVVVLLVQPFVPLFTAHINQSLGPRRTTVGVTMVWFSPLATNVGGLQEVGALPRTSSISFSV